MVFESKLIYKSTNSLGYKTEIIGLDEL